MKSNLLGMELYEIEDLILSLGEKEYRAKQLYEWIYKKKETSLQKMHNLPSTLRKKLHEKFDFALPQLVARQASSLDGTVKYLFKLKDEEKIEMVYIPHLKGDNILRNTFCISSQSGCSIGCGFCATGKLGLRRNLQSCEIIGQILAVENKEGIMANNVVFMGMGEPLLNYSNVIKSIKIISTREGFGISPRKITVSTSGIVPGIYRLARENIPLVLAVSLHSADDKIRNSLVPINKKYPIEKLLEACNYFVSITNRKITFEYVLLKDVNDSEKDALKLAKTLRGMLCNVNLIPFNSVEDSFYKKPPVSKIEKFKNLLDKKGIECVVRLEKGADISAACGQLRGKTENLN